MTPTTALAVHLVGGGNDPHAFIGRVAGATVDIMSGNGPSASGNGHFFSSVVGGRMVPRVIALSGKNHGKIRMAVDGAEPFTIYPDWIDSVIGNPVFLALVHPFE
ncbi:hypothetical protein [Phaeovulum sp.]|uniref:hypothetical protein n=1 Tax=Phaeovulum sp. TaxID=2934796 RepID=UPI0039E4DE50